MPRVPVIDANGTERESLTLPPEVFGSEVRVPLLHQAVMRELAARRAGTHDSRGRSEVSGGGRKPWRQKGTGRARQGSIRATQWKGGGKPFGPTPRKYTQRLPRQARRTALRAALAARIAAGDVRVVDHLELPEEKTGALVRRLRAFGVGSQPTLLLVTELGDGLARAARNVPWLTVETPAHASVYQLLRYRLVIFERSALLTLQEVLSR
jgi:large subunit ribosomal protein L4